MKPLGLEQLLKMAENEQTVSLKQLIPAIIDRFKAMDAKLNEVMQTHAEVFDGRLTDIGKVVTELRHFTTVPLFNKVESCEQRLDKLERPGKTDNNMG